MQCPNCAETTKVINTIAKYDSVYRVRQCLACGYRFTTNEIEDNSEHVLRALKDRWRQYRGRRRKK